MSTVKMTYMNKISDLNMHFESITRTDFTKKTIQKLGLRVPSFTAYDVISDCIVYEMPCLRCNYRFKTGLNRAGISYGNNICCPYCGREDQLRIQKGRLL